MVRLRRYQDPEIDKRGFRNRHSSVSLPQIFLPPTLPQIPGPYPEPPLANQNSSSLFLLPIRFLPSPEQCLNSFIAVL